MAAAVPVNLVGYGNPLYNGCLLPAFSHFSLTLRRRPPWGLPAGRPPPVKHSSPPPSAASASPQETGERTSPLTPSATEIVPGLPVRRNLVLQASGHGTDRITRSSGFASRQRLLPVRPQPSHLTRLRPTLTSIPVPNCRWRFDRIHHIHSTGVAHPRHALNWKKCPPKPRTQGPNDPAQPQSLRPKSHRLNTLHTF